MNKAVIWFTKITGYIPNLLYLRRKTYYLNKSNQSRKIKTPSIIISNHKAFMDFPLHMYTFLGTTVCPLVAEITYGKNKAMVKFMEYLGAIKVDRVNYDFSFIGDSVDRLDRGCSVLVFPEGRLPDEGEELNEFKPSFVYMAMETGAPIIPVYTNGEYGFKGKAKIVIGEKIYVNDLIDKNLSTKENIDNITKYFYDYIEKLGDVIHENEK